MLLRVASVMLLIGSGLVGGLACREQTKESIRVGPHSVVSLLWTTPPGFVVNDTAPSRVELKRLASNGSAETLSEWNLESLKKGSLDLSFEGKGPGELVLEGRFYLCRKEQSKICVQSRKSQRLQWDTEIPVDQRLRELSWKLEAELGGTELAE